MKENVQLTVYPRNTVYIGHVTVTRHKSEHCKAILTVCYFVQSNPVNQERIGQGEQPTILQQLCLLPFDYYSGTPKLFSLFHNYSITNLCKSLTFFVRRFTEINFVSNNVWSMLQKYQ